VISPTQRTLPGNMQHSHETDIRAPGEIRTHNPGSERPQTHVFRPCVDWNRRCNIYCLIYTYVPSLCTNNCNLTDTYSGFSLENGEEQL